MNGLVDHGDPVLGVFDVQKDVSGTRNLIPHIQTGVAQSCFALWLFSISQVAMEQFLSVKDDAY